MKCDELKRFDIVGKYRDEETMQEFRPDGVCYDADDVDAAIAELKAENQGLKRALYKACANWARSERYTEATWHGDVHREELWANVQAKCQAKAEECK